MAFKKSIQQQKSFEILFTRGIFDVEQKLQISDGEDEKVHNIRLKPQISEEQRIKSGCFDVFVDTSKECLSIQIVDVSLSQLTYICNGLRHSIGYCYSKSGVWLLVSGQNYFVQAPSPFVSERQEEDSLDILTSMLGKVVAVHVSSGEQVEKGSVICTIEAMKMEHQMCAKSDGKLEEIYVKVGDQVKAGQLLGRLAEV